MLSGDDEIEIEILSRREQNDEMACVSYDGDTTAEMCIRDRLELLKDEIRQFLIESISVTGGHLASNLGVVELTMALHLCFCLLYTSRCV